MAGGRGSAEETLAAVDSYDFEGAREAVAPLAARGRRTIATTGFDGSAVARHMAPALRSVRRPTEETGRTMARVLVQEITQPSPERPRIALPTERGVRDST
ncbi:substrate-binding domain-containing protein [Streptomyces xantholiticus]